MAGSGSDLTWQSSGAPTHGTIGDINTMRVSPDYLGMGQDVIIDTAGLLRSRGGFQSLTSDTFANLRIMGAAQLPTNSTTNAGTILPLIDVSNENYLYGTSATALTGFAKLTTSGNSGTNGSMLNGTLSPSFARLPDDKGIVIASGATNIGGNGFTNWGNVHLWGGNAVTTSTTVTGTAASTIGTKAVAGAGTAWTSALIGCYLFIGAGTAAKYVGQVDQVTSTTALILRKGAVLTVAAAAPAFMTSRAPMHMVYKGRITTNLSSPIVIGSNTKFATSGPAGSGPAWFTFGTGATLFRYSDGAIIGQVSSVNNDTTITMSGNAAIALVNEEYYAVNNSLIAVPYTIYSQPSAAFSATCVEYYADRYWYGAIAASDNSIKSGGVYYNSVSTAAYSGSNTLAFTKKNDPECLDLDPQAGDTLKLPTGASADTVRALFATRGGLVVFRLNDTFLLTGYSPDTFRLVKICDDGTFFNATVKAYKDGVVWAGKKSIWYFDGTHITDLLSDKVKRFYRRANGKNQTTFGTTGVGLAVISDHVLMSLGCGSTLSWPYKNTTKSVLCLTTVINMGNGAISFFTNIAIQNSLINNDGTGIIVAAGDNSAASFLLNGDKVFNDSATGADNFDAVTGARTFTSGTQIGPDVMFETTKITFGDATKLKTFKRFLMNYSSDVSMTATIIGTNLTDQDFPNLSTGTVSSDTFAVSSGTGILHRLRYLVRTPAVSIRVYQTNTTTATSQRLKIMWWAIGGKIMRQGRVQA